MHWPFPEQDALVQALGWTLLHSLWQGLLLALVAGLIMLLTKNVRAGARYIMLVSLMALFLAAAAGTFIHELRLPASAPQSTVNGRPELAEGSTTPGTVYEESTAGNALLPALTDNITAGHNRFSDQVIAYFNTHAPLIVLVWFIIFSARFVKLLAGLLQVQRLPHHKTNTLSGGWAQRVQEMAASLFIRRRIQFLESAMVQVPVVMGVFKPVILIPLGLITHLPAQQVEAILWHELGHIKRKDYLVNLLQSFAETIFFFNPAILWISSLVREERENCCDDIALSGSENKAAFLEALVSFQEYNNNISHFGMAFPGKKNHLLNRVKRILHQQNKTLNTMEKSLLTLSMALIMLFILATARPVQAQDDSKTAAGKSNRQETLVPVLPPPPPVIALLPAPPMIPAKQTGHVKPIAAIDTAPVIKVDIAPVPAVTDVRLKIENTIRVNAAPVIASARVQLDNLAKVSVVTDPVVMSDVAVKATPLVLVITDTVPPEKSAFPHMSTSINDDGKTKTMSISATDREGKTYKLNKINDDVTFLSVDGVEIPKEKYPDYQSLIDRLQHTGESNMRKPLFKIREVRGLKIDTLHAKTWSLQKKMQHTTTYPKEVNKDLSSDFNTDRKLKQESVTVYGYNLQLKKGHEINKLQAVQFKKSKLFLTKSDYKPYPVIVKKVYSKEQEAADLQRQKDLMRAVISELLNDGLIKSEKHLTWLGLTDTDFIINGNKQPADVLEKYRSRFLTHPGLGLFYGPVQMTGKGYFLQKTDL